MRLEVNSETGQATSVALEKLMLGELRTCLILWTDGWMGGWAMITPRQTVCARRSIYAMGKGL